VTRAHVIAWRDDLACRELSATTVRHRLSALASLFEYLRDKNAVTHNPVKGVKRPGRRGYGRPPRSTAESPSICHTSCHTELDAVGKESASR
jgi:site-specific recombinase XerC